MNKLEEIAPDSTLIRVLSRLFNLTDYRAAYAYQQILNRLCLRYSVFSLEGRLEFIADLIFSKKAKLNAAEKRALYHLWKQLRAKKDNGKTLFDFSIDYLNFAITACGGDFSDKTCQPIQHIPALNVLLALCLSGYLAAGCAKEKSPVSSGTEKAGTPIQVIQRALVNQTIRNQEPDRLNLLEKITQELNASARAHSPAVETDTTQDAVYRGTYQVQKGDSLRTIADTLGLDYKEIVRLNNVRYDRKRNWFVLYPGQVLQLPAGMSDKKQLQDIAQVEDFNTDRGDIFYLPETASEKGYTYHLVTRGESLWGISKKYQVSLQKIAAVNSISDPHTIRYGMMLKIPVHTTAALQQGKLFQRMTREEKVLFLKQRTIQAAHQYIDALVDVSEEHKIDARLYASLIWEESWFDHNATSPDNCRRLAQLDPRFHVVTDDIKENFRKSLRYLRHEFVYYRRKGFDMRAATICALAAYNGGNTRIRRYIRTGQWNGRTIETIPLKETRDHLKKVQQRCEANYQARL